MRVNEEAANEQERRLEKLRRQRDAGKVKSSLERLQRVAQTEDNTVPAILECVENYCTLGEICQVFRGVFGEQDGSESERVIKIRDALQKAKIGVEISKDIQTSLWTKLVKICGFSGMACMTGVPFADVLDTPETNKLTRMVMQEVMEQQL